MILPDVNVLIGAMREESTQHRVATEFLRHALAQGETLAWNSLFHSGLVRIVSHPRYAAGPSSTSDCFEFLNRLRAVFPCVDVQEGPRFWDLFQSLVDESEIAGRHVTDALFAALAIEHRATLVTFDRDFLQFKDLRLILLETQ